MSVFYSSIIILLANFGSTAIDMLLHALHTTAATFLWSCKELLDDIRAATYHTCTDPKQLYKVSEFLKEVCTYINNSHILQCLNPCAIF